MEPMARCVRPEKGRVSAFGFRLTGVIVAVVATVLLACTPAASALGTSRLVDFCLFEFMIGHDDSVIAPSLTSSSLNARVESGAHKSLMPTSWG